MNTLLNLAFLAAAILFLGVVHLQASREPPPPEQRSGWPLRQFWVSARLRHVGLVLGGLSALCGIGAALVTGIRGEDLPGRPVLLQLAGALVLLGAGMLAYSVILYRRESRPEPDGF